MGLYLSSSKETEIVTWVGKQLLTLKPRRFSEWRSAAVARASTTKTPRFAGLGTDVANHRMEITSNGCRSSIAGQANNMHASRVLGFATRRSHAMAMLAASIAVDSAM